MAFDTLFTTNHIQVMKALLPYFDSSLQKHLAIYIKYQELQYTIAYFHKYPYRICGNEPLNEKNFSKIAAQILPYLSEEEKKGLARMEQLMQSMEMYQEVMQTMELMKDIMPEGASFSDFFGGAQAAEQSCGNGADNADGAGAAAAGSPGGTGGDTRDGASGGSFGLDMLLELLSPEQKQMFELIKGGLDS